MRRVLLRATVALAGFVLVVVGAAGPASAIETASFGLLPAGSSGRTALHEDVRPGERRDDAVRLWNKTDQPIVVRLSVQGAAIDGAGQVSLGGTGGAAEWVSLASTRVSLPARGSVDVALTVRAPRTMPAGETTAAIVAEAEPAGGTAHVSVVQRVALMVYAQAPAGSPLKASLGWALWVAVGLLALVVPAAVWRRRSVVAAGHVDGKRLELSAGLGR